MPELHRRFFVDVASINLPDLLLADSTEPQRDLRGLFLVRLRSFRALITCVRSGISSTTSTLKMLW